MRLFTSDELRWIGIGVAGATFIAVLIAVIVALSGRPRNVSAPQVLRNEALRPADLLIPDEYLETALPRWDVFREPQVRWSAGQIEKFWIDPLEIELEQIRAVNDRLIEGIFEKIP